MSLTRNTLAAALCAVALTLSLAACGRDEPDLENGKAQFVEKCGSCHTLARAGTAGTQGPNLDKAFQTALADGIDRDTVEGIVHKQILHPRKSSIMPAGLVKGNDARDVAAYVGYAAARPGDDSGVAGLGGPRPGDDGRPDLHGGGLRRLPHVRARRLDWHHRTGSERPRGRGHEVREGQAARGLRPRVDRQAGRLHRPRLPQRDARLPRPPDGQADPGAGRLPAEERRRLAASLHAALFAAGAEP